MTATCAKCGFRRTQGSSKCTRCGAKAAAPHLPWDAVEPTTFGDAPLEIDAGADEGFDEEPISQESVSGEFSGEFATDGEIHPDHVAAAVLRAVEAARSGSSEEAARAADVARMAAQSLARQRQSERVQGDIIPVRKPPRRARAEFTAVSDYLDDSQLELEQSAEKSEPSVALVPAPQRAMVRQPARRTNPPPRVNSAERQRQSAPARVSAPPRPPVRDLVAEYENVRPEPAPRRFPTAFVAGFGCASFMFGAFGMGAFGWMAYNRSLSRPEPTVASVAPQPMETPVRVAAVATPAPTPMVVAQATARPAPSPVNRISAFHPAPAPVPVRAKQVAAAPRPVATPAPRMVAMAPTRPAPTPRAATPKSAPASSASSGSGLPWDDAPASAPSHSTKTAAASSGGSGLPWEDSSPAVDPLADPAPAPKAAGAGRVIHSRGGDKPVDLNKNIALTGADGHTVVGKLISVQDGFVDVKTTDSSVRIAEKDVVDAATY